MGGDTVNVVEAASALEKAYYADNRDKRLIKIIESYNHLGYSVSDIENGVATNSLVEE